jgi:hypothetical protein
MKVVCRWLAVVIIVACTAMTVTCSTSKAKVHRDVRIPKIAQILGIRVGQGTVEELERKLGPGAPVTGGHPQGARVWYVKSMGIWVYADGFYYTSRGEEITNDVLLTVDNKNLGYDSEYRNGKKRSVPVVHKTKIQIAWLGKVVPGMTRQEVTKAVKSLPKPKEKSGNLIWKEKGTYKTAQGLETMVWTAELMFDKDKLVSVGVSTD